MKTHGRAYENQGLLPQYQYWGSLSKGPGHLEAWCWKAQLLKEPPLLCKLGEASSQLVARGEQVSIHQVNVIQVFQSAVLRPPNKVSMHTKVGRCLPQAHRPLWVIQKKVQHWCGWLSFTKNASSSEWAKGHCLLVWFFIFLSKVAFHILLLLKEFIWMLI